MPLPLRQFPQLINDLLILRAVIDGFSDVLPLKFDRSISPKDDVATLQVFIRRNVLAQRTGQYEPIRAVIRRRGFFEIHRILTLHCRRAFRWHRRHFDGCGGRRWYWGYFSQRPSLTQFGSGVLKSGCGKTSSGSGSRCRL